MAHLCMAIQGHDLLSSCAFALPRRAPSSSVSSCIHLWESIIQPHPITREDGRSRHAQEEEMDFGEQLAISAPLSVFTIRVLSCWVSLGERHFPIHHSRRCCCWVRLTRVCGSSSLSREDGAEHGKGDIENPGSSHLIQETGVPRCPPFRRCNAIDQQKKFWVY